MTPSLLERPLPESGASPSALLDVLRGVAILAVFVQHLGDRFMGAWESAVSTALPKVLAPWVLTVLHHAYWGVDLFFVLSGMTLARGYASRYGQGKGLPAKDFLRRRVRRIVPAFGVAVGVMLVAHPRVLVAPGIAASLGLHALLLQGIAPEGLPVLIGAAWSITTESHFYLLMPLLAPSILRPSRPLNRALSVAILVMLLAWLSRATLCALFVGPEGYGYLFELTQRRLATSRIDQFVLGIVAVRLGLDRLSLARPWRAMGFSALGLVIAFRLEGSCDRTALGTAAYALIGLLTTALVCAVLALPERAERSVVGRGMAALGVVSYGVFLYHQLALGLVGALFPGAPSVGLSLLVGGVALAVSFGAGLLSFRFVERPFLARKRPSPEAQEGMCLESSTRSVESGLR